MAEQGEKRMWIAEINTPDFCGSEIEVREMGRSGSTVVCDTLEEDISKLIIEFEDESSAEGFENAVHSGRAQIQIEANFSMETVNEEMKLEYELAKISGDKDRLEAVLKELWEGDGIDPERTKPREMSGIKRIVTVLGNEYGGRSVLGIGFRDPKGWETFEQWLKTFGLSNADHISTE